MKILKFAGHVLLSTGLIGVAKAEEINLTINGMVCAFCAQGLADLARSFDPVERAYVDMDNRLVVLDIKSGATMSDDTVREYVKEAGYDLESFFRTDQSTAANVERLRALLGRELPSRPSSAYIFEVPSAEGGKDVYARLTIYKQHSRNWQNMLQSGDEKARLFGTAPAATWWPSVQDLAGFKQFDFNGHTFAMNDSGTVVLVKVQQS